MAPSGDGELPVRAWARPSGALLGFQNVAQISARGTQICLLATDGAVWCLRTDAALNGHVLAADALAHNVSRVPLAEPVREVTTGNTHACAIGLDGAAWCWGSNDDGELGDGTSTQRLVPTRVIGLDSTAQMAAGDRFTCARTMDDRGWCWGRNASGQLGDGTRVARHRPVLVTALGALADIAAGRQHACARTHDGHAFCWGDNTHRQLGCAGYTSPACTDPALNEPRPVRVPGVDRVSQLALGDAHSCARRFNDTVACWGERTNSAGQVGYGLDAWPEDWAAMQLAAGPNGSCAVMDSSAVRCWGDFAFDAFDRGENAQRSYELPEVRGATTVVMGDRLTCVRLGDASARCWLR